MRKIEKENGEIVYSFEPHEEKQKAEFERNLLADDVVEDLYHNLVKALAEAKRQGRNAWKSVAELLKQQHGVSSETDLVYNWLTGEIREGASAESPLQSRKSQDS